MIEGEVARTRKASGVPAKVTDEDTLRRLAAIIRNARLHLWRLDRIASPYSRRRAYAVLG